MRKLPLLVLVVVLAAACGAKSSQPTSMPGNTHAPGSEHINSTASSPIDAGIPPKPDAAPPAPPVTFELKNSSPDTDISFANDKGWQTAFLSYTGKPPKAKSALFFPKSCTAACDAADACPVCPEPVTDSDRKKAEIAAEAARTTIKAGDLVDVPWDAKLLQYQKSANGKCECYVPVDPPADSYTVKVCGIRPAKKAGEPSSRPCIEQQVQLPAPPGTKVTLDFAK